MAGGGATAKKSAKGKAKAKAGVRQRGRADSRTSAPDSHQRGMPARDAESARSAPYSFSGDGEELKLDKDRESNLSGEYGNIAILLVLYTLQGLPMGLSAVLPSILKERGVSFSELGVFSLNSWPFSLKLLWAPLVDTVYIRSIGRRKTWMIPSQALIGLVMLGMSTCVNDMIYAEKPAVVALTVLFFILYFLCATQDIAVDGWALTMLRPENVGWAATCNALGQTVGYAIGFTGYMVLEQWNIATLSSFMFGMGVLFLVVTALVAIFKAESPLPLEEEPEGIVQSYRELWSILKLRHMRKLILVLFTWKACFSVAELAPLVIQENGVPKEHLAYMTSLLVLPLSALPLVAARWSAGKTPIDLAIWCYLPRVALTGALALVAVTTPSSVQPVPWFFYGIVLLIGGLKATASEFQFVSQMAFFSRISDPSMGGTYMTLLNTIANLGNKWPSTAAYALVDRLTCLEDTCMVKAHGFYTVTAFSVAIGVLWYALGAPVLRELQQLKVDDWKVRATS